MEGDEEHADRMKRARHDDDDDEHEHEHEENEMTTAAAAALGMPAVTVTDDDEVKRELMDTIVDLDERGVYSCRATWNLRRRGCIQR